MLARVSVVCGNDFSLAQCPGSEAGGGGGGGGGGAKVQRQILIPTSKLLVIVQNAF